MTLGSQILTREEGRALLAQQKGSKNSQKQAKVERTPPATPKEPRAPEAALETKQTSQKEYYPHPYHIQVANGTHYPGRVRVVITGPAADNLPAYLVNALEEFNRLAALQR